MSRFTTFIVCLLLLCSLSSALSNIVRLDIGTRTPQPANQPVTAEMMQDSRISSPFVSPLLAMWARPRRLAFKRFDIGEQYCSHASSFIPLAKRVQSSGNHSVHLQMTVYEEEIDLGLPVEHVELFGIQNPFVSKEFIEAMWEVDFDVFMQRMVLGFGAKGCRLALENAKTRVEEIADAKWDLAMVDSLFAVCGYGIAARSGAPVVYMHSSDMEPAPGTMKAFGRNYGILPMNHMTGGKDDFDPSNFLDRLHSTAEWMLGYYFYAVEWGTTMEKVLSTIVPSFNWLDFHRNLAFSFVDMPDLLFPPAPRTNDVFFHGAYCPATKPLPDEWREFVEDPESKGTIIVAFGTYVHWSLAPVGKREAFRLALNRLSSYRIVWAYKGVDDWRNPPIEVGTHIRVHSWIPQSALLAHPKTVLIMTHGGLKSVRESICSAVPAIFMPFFAEQARNAYLVRRAGFAEMLDRHTITEDVVHDKIVSVISSTAHGRAAKRFVKQMLDRPMDALDEAAFHVNRLLKKRGPEGMPGLPSFFYPRGRLQGFIEYLNLDLLLALPLLLIGILTF